MINKTYIKNVVKNTFASESRTSVSLLSTLTESEGKSNKGKGMKTPIDISGNFTALEPRTDIFLTNYRLMANLLNGNLTALNQFSSIYYEKNYDPQSLLNIDCGKNRIKALPFKTDYKSEKYRCFVLSSTNSERKHFSFLTKKYKAFFRKKEKSGLKSFGETEKSKSKSKALTDSNGFIKEDTSLEASPYNFQTYVLKKDCKNSLLNFSNFFKTLNSFTDASSLKGKAFNQSLFVGNRNLFLLKTGGFKPQVKDTNYSQKKTFIKANLMIKKDVFLSVYRFFLRQIKDIKIGKHDYGCYYKQLQSQKV